MQLNIGCGPYKAAGWINVDRNPSFDPDTNAAFELPFADGNADRVYLGHILEHLTYDDEAPRMLREVERVLRTGGQLAVVGPDLDAAIELGLDQEILDDIAHRQPEDEADVPGKWHRWTATEANTLELVRQVFPDSQVADLAALDADGWPLTSLTDWQTGILAERR